MNSENSTPRIAAILKIGGDPVIGLYRVFCLQFYSTPNMQKTAHYLSNISLTFHKLEHYSFHTSNKTYFCKPQTTNHIHLK